MLDSYDTWGEERIALMIEAFEEEKRIADELSKKLEKEECLTH